MPVWNLLCGLRHSHAGTKKRTLSNFFPQIWKYKIFPSPIPQKEPHSITPPPPNFTVGTMQAKQVFGAAKTRVVNQTRYRSVISHSKEHVFTAPVSPVTARFTPLHLMLGNVRCACSILTMGTHAIELPEYSFCADFHARGGLCGLLWSCLTRPTFQ